MINVVVTPAGPGRFAARVDGRQLGAFRTPLFSAARVLMAEGVSPETTITMRHDAEACVSLTSTVGTAARLTVEEGPNVGPRLGPYRPFEGTRSGSRDDG